MIAKRKVMLHAHSKMTKEELNEMLAQEREYKHYTKFADDLAWKNNLWYNEAVLIAGQIFQEDLKNVH